MLICNQWSYEIKDGIDVEDEFIDDMDDFLID
jgi:hypothetical protein